MFMIRRRKMANEALKNICQYFHSKITTSVSPDSVMDDLLSKNVISSDDYDRLHQVPTPRDRCRKLLSLLYLSSHPQVFIYLRLALLKEYPWLADEIDKQLPSITFQLQQLQLDHTNDGEVLSIIFVLVYFCCYQP